MRIRIKSIVKFYPCGLLTQLTSDKAKVYTQTMKTDIYLKLQKKFGGKWVATSKTGHKVYSQAKNVDLLFKDLKRKAVSPQKTAIGFIEKYGQVSAYFSLSVQTN